MHRVPDEQELIGQNSMDRNGREEDNRKLRAHLNHEHETASKNWNKEF